jgi:hypothetical protein
VGRHSDMDTFTKLVYAGEITKQCRFALNAVQHLNHALSQLRERRDTTDEVFNEVFRAIHSFLTHASNISRMFWPAQTRQRQSIVRARALRHEYGLGDKHPLKSRSLRNHLEHFDERLDHWRENSRHRNIVNDIIGPANTIVGVDRTDLMRWFDPATKNFLFRGETYNLQEIASAVDELLPRSRRLEQELWERLRAETR